MIFFVVIFVTTKIRLAQAKYFNQFPVGIQPNYKTYPCLDANLKQYKALKNQINLDLDRLISHPSGKL